MVNISRTVDKDGFVTKSRRRSRPSECNPSNEPRGMVERKIIGASMGKKGRNDVVHVTIWSGNKRRFCWLNFRGGIWLARLLKREANGGDGRLSKWNFRENEDWMLDFIRLQVSHNKAYPDTLFFPAGNNGGGWYDTGVFLEDLLEVIPINPIINAWCDSNRKDYSQLNKDETQLPLAKPLSDKGLKSLWNRTLVVEIASSGVEFDWKDVGKWVMNKFGWNLGLELQPIDECRAVFTVNSFTDFSRVRKFGNWKVEDVDIRIFPWFAGVNAIHKPDSLNIKKQWIGVKGVPFNMWDFNTFKIIGDKFGGLIDISAESSMADLSEIRVLVGGPVNNCIWCEELIIHDTRLWVEIRLIGDVLEPSRQNMKPVYITIDRMEPPPGFFWRRKPSPFISNKEEDNTLRGSKLSVDQVQRPSVHVSGKQGHGQPCGSRETVVQTSSTETRVQSPLILKSSNLHFD
ncbi:hypothetical protein MKX03_007941 [Papaver bracteatum]|nr:hypothetical protein MKX03_007941 [Papaver bracteatum]